jgi:hypothetical protein
VLGASVLGVTMRIVGWPISWAALTCSPVSAVAVKLGIGLFESCAQALTGESSASISVITVLMAVFLRGRTALRSL